MSPSKDDLHGSGLDKGDILRDSISGGALDDLFLGGGGNGALAGAGAFPGIGGLNGKLMGAGSGTNPLAALFAASNAGGIPNPAGLQQVRYPQLCIGPGLVLGSIAYMN